jgi:DNA-binding MarR family transcriptional regulator
MALFIIVLPSSNYFGRLTKYLMEGKSTQTVADLLNSAAIHLLRRAAEEDRTAGLSPARLSALSVVVFTGPLTVGALAEAEHVRPATMTGIVTGLEQAGLVRRKKHGSDGRAVLVEATAAGKRLLTRARAKRIDAIAERFADLTAAELHVLWEAGQLLEVRFGRRPWRPVR